MGGSGSFDQNRHQNARNAIWYGGLGSRLVLGSLTEPSTERCRLVVFPVPNIKRKPGLVLDPSMLGGSVWWYPPKIPIIFISYLSWNSRVHLFQQAPATHHAFSQEGGKGTENKQEKVKFRRVLTGSAQGHPPRGFGNVWPKMGKPLIYYGVFASLGVPHSQTNPRRIEWVN